MVRTSAIVAALLLCLGPALAFGQQLWAATEPYTSAYNPLLPIIPTNVNRERSGTKKQSTQAKPQSADTRAAAAATTTETRPTVARNPQEFSWRTDFADPQHAAPQGNQQPEANNDNAAAQEADAPVAVPPVILSMALPASFQVRQLPNTTLNSGPALSGLQIAQPVAAPPRLPMIDGPATGQFSSGNQISSSAVAPQRPIRSVQLGPQASRSIQFRNSGGGCVLQGIQSLRGAP